MGMFSKFFRTQDTTSKAISEISIFRSNGELDRGWRVHGVQDNRFFVSSRELYKLVPVVDVLRAKPELRIGRKLRNSGMLGQARRQFSGCISLVAKSPAY